MKTLSDKQLAANRANAARSTGPRTPQGRLRASQNSRKHGLTASTFTAEGVEEADQLQNLIDDAVACYRPQNSQEQFAVERIALCQFAILRAYRLEAGLLTNCFTAGAVTPDRISFPTHDLPQRNNRPLATGFEQHAPIPFALLLRYQAQADRQYRRAVEDLERLIAQREEIPNEPISAESTEDTQAAEGGGQSPAPSPQPPAPAPRQLGRGLNALFRNPQPPAPNPEAPLLK